MNESTESYFRFEGERKKEREKERKGIERKKETE